MKTFQATRSTDPREVMSRIKKRFKRLSASQKVQALIDAEILTKKKMFALHIKER